MQLYRKLKAVCGLSVSDVIRKVRVQKAISLLLTSENNVSEIAYKLGFSDPFYFSKVFKKETGMSPLQYKKMQKDC
ncbi:MAG: helix-turn-helix transcriptional regulator [Parabacteroides sp.]|nr:helix-turn-helix transcriptional regulator [Parabacteroides sp.]